MGKIRRKFEPEFKGQMVEQVETATFYFNQRKRLFNFTVVKPDAHFGVKLEMFVRDDSKWKGRPPRSSKLFKSAAVALDRLPGKTDRITKGLFKDKLFRCRLRVSGHGPASYSVIDMLIERVAG